MKITEISNPNIIHGVTLVYEPKSAHKVKRIWADNGKDSKSHKGIVYFISVNDEIVKIGGSSNNIGGLISQYLINLSSKAEPRENRFCLYLKILRHLINGDVVKYHYLPIYDMTTYCEGMFNETLTATHREFRIVESRLIDQYKTIHDGEVPIWNNSEGTIGWESSLIKLFDDRELALKSGVTHWDYDKYVKTLTGS